MPAISSSDFIKAGGFFGFSLVFLVVLIKDRDVVTALLEASIACVVLGFLFKLLHSFAMSLRRASLSEREPEQFDDTRNKEMESLTDGQNKT